MSNEFNGMEYFIETVQRKLATRDSNKIKLNGKYISRFYKSDIIDFFKLCGAKEFRIELDRNVYNLDYIVGYVYKTKIHTYFYTPLVFLVCDDEKLVCVESFTDLNAENKLKILYNLLPRHTEYNPVSVASNYVGIYSSKVKRVPLKELKYGKLGGR